jgi:general secretion pathway protein G
MEVEIMRRRSGFTLIEMMIVLAIIAALSATLVPIAMNALNQAKVTGNLTDLESIRLAEMQYYYKKGTVTTNTSDELDVYLTWNNLQKANGVNYSFEDVTTPSKTIIVNVPFGNENLAKAFLAQWTNRTNAVADYSNSGSTTGDIQVTYTFE